MPPRPSAGARRGARPARERPTPAEAAAVPDALTHADAPLPSTNELVVLGAPSELRDGSRVRIRQVHAPDRRLLLQGFERLSPKSRYRRFLAPMPTLNEPMARYLTELDHHDHEAMIAVDEKTGDGVGVARYVRGPARPEVAELALTVIDDWQGRGLGTLLLDVISARARAEGITAFTGLMLAANEEMMELLRRLDDATVVDRGPGTVEVEVPIPEVGLSPALHKLLGIAARSEVMVPLARGQGARAPG